MALWNSILELTMGESVPGMIIYLSPVWVAFFLGLMLGWAWKPRWTDLGNCKSDISVTSSPSTSVNPRNDVIETEPVTSPCTDTAISSSSQVKSGELVAVKEDDLEHFCRLVKKKDGGPPWKLVMERSTSDMSYQAWQRDPETGPPQYCSKTVYENATPELLRDFYWDDEFRLKWDDIIHAQTVEECPTTGTMIVHWIRKFPFFCSNREYIIGRRIWESGRSYYCVTKGVPYDSIPRRDKPRRVDLYYSSWFIQAVESKKDSDHHLTACEVILFHHEDMGIPWEIAKFGVRQGMWGTVREIERGFRAYQKGRASGAPISHHAFMAQINAKIDPDYIKGLENGEVPSQTEVVCSPEKPEGINIPKFLVIGGAVVVACSVDHGLLTRTVIFSIARTFANIGRLARPGR